MNYRHAYHAGNHADVLKHIVLTSTLVHLQRKPKPVRVIDAHAGISYDPHGIEAGKTGEWEGGIGKMGPPFAPEIEDLRTVSRRHRRAQPARGLRAISRIAGTGAAALRAGSPCRQRTSSG
ncbi:MAG: hypothetical protein U1F47_03140 [Hyphomicrobiales bacterium]